MNNIHVSGELITSLCDVAIYTKHYLDTYTNIKQYCKNTIYVGSVITTQDISCFTSFFIQTDHIRYFELMILPHITNKFILVTHNSDLLSGQNANILSHPLLIKWYGQNMIPHVKTGGIPIGLENSQWNGWDYRICEQHKTKIKSNLLYVNFSLNTNKNRQYIMNTILSKGFKQNTIKPWKQYIEELATYKYAISPEGNGVDCHRIWECIYVGCVPVVIKNPILYEHFKTLPILWVDTYVVVSETFLNNAYNSIVFANNDITKLDYWNNIINIRDN